MATPKKDFKSTLKFCKNCGEPLELKVSRDLIRKNFCSRRCNGIFRGKKAFEDPVFREKFISSSHTLDVNMKRSEKMKRENHPLWVGMDLRNCLNCNKEFSCRKTKNNKYCSLSCSLKKIHQDNIGDKVEKIEYSCIICGNPFKRSINYKYNPLYCSYRCNGIDRCKKSKKSRTDIEILLAGILESMNLDFIEQINVKNVSVVDFLLDDLIIFADGEYWHNLPGRLDRDKEQTEKLERLGYKVFRFSGGQIKNNPEYIKEKIYNYYESN